MNVKEYFGIDKLFEMSVLKDFKIKEKIRLNKLVDSFDLSEENE